jgi:hypothetical protein
MDQLLPPDQTGCDTLLGDGLEEAAEEIEPIPLADARQAGVIGERFGQIVPEGVSAD